jgi:tetratricopeptide (TPR) repeat protein
MCLVGIALAVASPVASQSPKAIQKMRQQQQEAEKRIQQQLKAAAENMPSLPEDPQLLALHREFIGKAEKLATEYEQKKQFDRAREVYESLVRLVPKYDKAESGLKRILNAQAVADRKVTEVQASRYWQDSGASLVQGMPVHVEIKGTWKVVIETGPEGIQIPEEIRPDNPKIRLGTLIAVIANSASDLEEAKPFTLNTADNFIAPKSGRLFLRMFDIDPSDNEGKLHVMIQSSFSR